MKKIKTKKKQNKKKKKKNYSTFHCKIAQITEQFQFIVNLHPASHVQTNSVTTQNCYKNK